MMTPTEYRKEVQERARELADEWRSTWSTDAGQNYKDLMADPEAYFEDIVKRSGRDWGDVATDIAKATGDRMKEEDEIGAAMGELGFGTMGTGGGCEAYSIDVNPPEYYPHFLVTDNDCNLPTRWDQEGVIGYYPDELENGDTESYETVRELIDLLRRGKGHPEWKGGAGGKVQQTGGGVSPADLDVINRHRRALGMAPLDRSMGWGDQELRDMAESIRTTGRMNNPAQKRLKAKLMR